MISHIVTAKTVQTGSSSHYDIPFYSTLLECSCGWSKNKGNPLNYFQEIEKAFQDHQIDVITKHLGLEFSFIREKPNE